MIVIPYSSSRSKRALPLRSCFSCHARKVKCDRQKPCTPCRSRGVPSNCEYANTAQEHVTREPGDTVERLREKCKKLEQELAELKSTCRSARSTRTISTSDHGSDQNEISLPPSLPSTDAVLDNLVQRLLDRYSPRNDRGQMQFTVLQQVASLTCTSPLIREALHATSLLTLGRFESNKRIESAGYVRYNNAIRLLGRSLLQLDEQCSLEALAATYLFGVIEMSSSSPSVLFKHATWALHLLQHRSPLRHQTGLGKALFLEVRIYWVTFAILRRRHTFLATEEWLTIPWGTDEKPKDLLQELLDIASRIPSFLAESDYTVSMINEHCLSPIEMQSVQEKLHIKETRILRQLMRWEGTLDAMPGGISESPTPYRDDFPILQYHDPNMGIAFATHYEYSNVLLANAMCYYWALLLTISEPTPISLGSLESHERYVVACKICRSIRYFVRTAPGSLIYRLLLPMLLAYNVFAPGSVEATYLEDVSHFIQRHFGTSLFRTLMNADSGVDYRQLSKLF